MMEVLCRPTRLSLTQARMLCAVVAIVLSCAIGVSAYWNLRAWYITSGRDHWQLGLQGGELYASWASADLDGEESDHETIGLSFEAERSDYGSVCLAWRPYHLGVNSGFHMDDLYHGVSLPLWLVALPAVVGAAYLHGRVVGAGGREK